MSEADDSAERGEVCGVEVLALLLSHYADLIRGQASSIEDGDTEGDVQFALALLLHCGDLIADILVGGRAAVAREEVAALREDLGCDGPMAGPSREGSPRSTLGHECQALQTARYLRVSRAHGVSSSVARTVCDFLLEAGSFEDDHRRVAFVRERVWFLFGGAARLESAAKVTSETILKAINAICDEGAGRGGRGKLRWEPVDAFLSAINVHVDRRALSKQLARALEERARRR